MDYSDITNRSNADYIDRLYQQYQTDSRSVDPHWQAFFSGFDGQRAQIAVGERTERRLADPNHRNLPHIP